MGRIHSSTTHSYTYSNITHETLARGPHLPSPRTVLPPVLPDPSGTTNLGHKSLQLLRSLTSVISMHQQNGLAGPPGIPDRSAVLQCTPSSRSSIVNSHHYIPSAPDDPGLLLTGVSSPSSSSSTLHPAGRKEAVEALPV